MALENCIPEYRIPSDDNFETQVSFFSLVSKSKPSEMMVFVAVNIHFIFRYQDLGKIDGPFSHT